MIFSGWASCDAAHLLSSVASCSGAEWLVHVKPDRRMVKYCRYFKYLFRFSIVIETYFIPLLDIYFFAYSDKGRRCARLRALRRPGWASTLYIASLPRHADSCHMREEMCRALAHAVALRKRFASIARNFERGQSGSSQIFTHHATT